LPEDIKVSQEKIIAHEFIDRKCTQIDRIRTLNTASQVANLTVFSDDNLSTIPNAIKKEEVSYLEQMPKVFKLSKINLNMTFKGIITGIPLRAFDIMGAGGFLLSSYQLELEKHFELDKDLVVYYNMKDMKEKIKYYIEHENERKDIALRGYMKVKNNHAMASKLSYIVDIVRGDN
jgi:spore maturation protein CgeB